MRAFRPPHLDRLRRRIEALDAPAVQLWAWPGSGQQAVLDALVAEGGQVAQPLSVEDLAEETSLRRAVAGAVAGSAPWLVLPAVPAPPRGAAQTVAALLPAGRRLLFASPERLPASPLATAYVGPREHLLTADESAALWSAVTGRLPSPALLAAVMAATDGWLRPLLLLAEVAAEGRGLADGALAAIPAVDSFLRHEVLAGLPPAERAMARWLAIGGGVDAGLWTGLLDAVQQAALGRLRDHWGLLLPAAAGGERLPAPLGALLAPEGWREPRAVGVAAALAAAERRRGRPVAALRLLAGAVERAPAGETAAAALDELVASAWVELLISAPLSLLATAVSRPAAGRTAGGELLGRLVRSLGAPEIPPRRRTGGGDVPPAEQGRWPADGRVDHGTAGSSADAEGAGPRNAVVDPETAAVARVAATLLGVPALGSARPAARTPESRWVAGGVMAAERVSGEARGDGSGESGLLDPGRGGTRAPEPPAPLPPGLEPLARLAAALRAVPAGAGPVDGGELGGDGEPAALAAALAALAPPSASRAPDLLPGAPALTAAGGGSPVPTGETGDPATGRWRFDRRVSAATALAAAGLSRLARQRPALAVALGRRADLAPAWRDRLEAPGPVAPAGPGYDLDLLGQGRSRRREPAQVHELSWPLKRAFKVLAYLATAPGWSAERAQLQDDLWPGADQAQLRRNFHPTLSHLRRSLEQGLGSPWPPPLLLEGGVYRLNPALAWRVDATELERLALDGRRSFDDERHERAVACWEGVRGLYRGPLLAGWDDGWIAARREQYQRLWLESLRGLGESYLRFSRLDEAMDALRTVLIHDPLQERAHVALMEVYARQGRRDLVHRQHDRLVDLLSRELGIDLADATEEAYQRLMA